MGCKSHKILIFYFEILFLKIIREMKMFGRMCLFSEEKSSRPETSG